MYHCMYTAHMQLSHTYILYTTAFPFSSKASRHGKKRSGRVRKQFFFFAFQNLPSMLEIVLGIACSLTCTTMLKGYPFFHSLHIFFLLSLQNSSVIIHFELNVFYLSLEINIYKSRGKFTIISFYKLF